MKHISKCVHATEVKQKKRTAKEQKHYFKLKTNISDSINFNNSVEYFKVKQSSFLQGWNLSPHSLFWGNPPILGTPSFWSKFKKLPSPSESHSNWCMRFVRNTLKLRCCVSYQVNWEHYWHYSFYFQAQLCIYYWHFLWLDIAFDVFAYQMHQEWTWNISNNYIIKSDVYIKLKYIRISLDIYWHIFYHTQNQKKKKENNISTMKTYQMPNKWQYLTCIKVSFSYQTCKMI